MRVLVIGGTGFIGPFLIHELERRGHIVAVFHRGRSAAAFPVSAQRIIGDRRNLAAHSAAFRGFRSPWKSDPPVTSRSRRLAIPR